MRLTGTGCAVLVAAGVLTGTGVLVGYPELVVLGGCAGALLTTALAWVATGTRVEARRLLRPSRVVEGGTVACELVATNTGRRPSPELELTEVVDGQRLRFHLPALAGRARAEVHRYELPARRRGVYRLPPPTVGRLDPARLVRRATTAGPTTTLYVHPKHHRLATFGAAGLRDVDGQASVPRGGGVAFYSLRPYVPGDDRRLIHWPSTARVGELMVRHNSMPDAPGYLVVLDTAADRYRADAFEEAVRVAASLCVAALRAGARLHLRTTDPGTAPPPATAVTPALDHLAGVAAGAHRPVWSTTLAHGGDVVGISVVSGRLDRPALAAVAGAAAGTGSVAVVQLGERAPGVGTGPGGMVTLTARTSTEFAAYWNGRPPR